MTAVVTARAGGGTGLYGSGVSPVGERSRDQGTPLGAGSRKPDACTRVTAKIRALRVSDF